MHRVFELQKASFWNRLVRHVVYIASIRILGDAARSELSTSFPSNFYAPVLSRRVILFVRVQKLKRVHCISIASLDMHSVSAHYQPAHYLLQAVHVRVSIRFNDTVLSGFVTLINRIVDICGFLQKK